MQAFVEVAVPPKRRTTPRPVLAELAAFIAPRSLPKAAEAAPPSCKSKPEPGMQGCGDESLARPKKKKSKRPLRVALPERAEIDISLLPLKKRYTRGVYEKSRLDISMSPPKKSSRHSKKKMAKPLKRCALPIRDVAFADIPVADKLRAELAKLGASDPVCVYRKQLSSSDMCVDQNRLLISCKNGRPCPFAKFFTPVELLLLHGKSDGLGMRAYDNVGDSYTLACRFLDSNKAYRLIHGWNTFLKSHHLDTNQFQHVEIEVWAFRSRELVPGLAEQDCGAVGLVLVPYYGPRRPEPGIGAGNPALGNEIVPDFEGAREEGDGNGARGGEDASGEEEVAPAVGAVTAATKMCQDDSC